MVESDKPARTLVSLLETALGQSNDEPVSPLNSDALSARAELSLSVVTTELESSHTIRAEERTALIAALFDGGLDAAQRLRLAAVLRESSRETQAMAADLAFLDGMAGRLAEAPAYLPTHLIEAAVTALQAKAAPGRNSADVIPFISGPAQKHPATRPLARSQDPPANADRFELLAAASKPDSQAMVCKSRSGIWTLEVFVGSSERDLKLKQGYLLLTVHPDHRATYEDRAARVFVVTPEGERTLAEEVVRKGEIYATISLAGLDLHTRDAINVVFATAAQDPGGL